MRLSLMGSAVVDLSLRMECRVLEMLRLIKNQSADRFTTPYEQLIRPLGYLTFDPAEAVVG